MHRYHFATWTGPALVSPMHTTCRPNNTNLTSKYHFQKTKNFGSGESGLVGWRCHSKMNGVAVYERSGNGLYAVLNLHSGHLVHVAGIAAKPLPPSDE